MSLEGKTDLFCFYITWASKQTFLWVFFWTSIKKYPVEEFGKDRIVWYGWMPGHSHNEDSRTGSLTNTQNHRNNVSITTGFCESICYQNKRRKGFWNKKNKSNIHSLSAASSLFLHHRVDYTHLWWTAKTNSPNQSGKRCQGRLVRNDPGQ